jgi:hypothetical protein
MFGFGFGSVEPKPKQNQLDFPESTFVTTLLRNQAFKLARKTLTNKPLTNAAFRPLVSSTSGM